MKRWLWTLAAAAGVLCGTQSARATSLVPGQTTSSIDTGSLSGGSLLASESQTVTDSSGDSVTLTTGVYKQASGSLDFIYQVTNPATNPPGTEVTSVSGVSFAGYTTDVYNVLSSAGGSFTTPTSGVIASGASRSSAPGSTVSFSFTDPTGDTTSLLVIKTNATGYSTSGSAGTIEFGNTGIGVAQFSKTFAPSPEPTSLVLLGGCVVGLAGVGAWRRWGRKVAPAVAA